MQNALKQRQAEISAALSIEDPSHETMRSVEQRLESLLKIFRAVPECAGLIPFCETYRLIARGMASIPTQNAYTRLDALTQLNVVFISYYFRALQQFIQTGEAPQPWQTYFDYCQRPHGSPFLQMILGVNAHINGDLPNALAESGYTDTHDYHLMNQLLEDEVPSIMWFLAFGAKDRLAFGGVIFRQFAREEFHEIVTNWRLEAWLSASALKARTFTPARLHVVTETIGQRLVEIFGDGSSFRRVTCDLQQVHSLRSLIVEARSEKNIS